MKTLLIGGGAAVPARLREIITRGSTSVQERAAADVGAGALDADRLVFWVSRGDDELRQLASRCARAEARQRKEIIVYVSTEDAPSVEGLASNEVYLWPRDEDRLKMAFMTGA